MITIAFDMDGTLFDCGDMIGNSWQRAVHEFMRRNNTVMKVPSTEEILNQIGFPPDVLFPKLFPMLDSEGLNEMIDLCTKALCDDIYAGAGRIYDGIPQLLMELKNHD